MKHKLEFVKFAVLAVAGVLCSIPAYGDLIVSTQSVIATPGSTGNAFDVLLTDSGPASVSIGGFSFEIAVSDPDITFTGVFTSTATAPYIFAGTSLFGPEIDTQLSPSVIAQDIAASGSTLNAGDTVGLGQVIFNVSSTAATGPFAVSFTGGLAGNDLSDPTGKNVPIDTLSGGTITISSVPEPSSIFLTVAGIAALAALRRRS